MIRDQLYWVHPNALQYGERQESGRYLHYHRHWQGFTLTLREYKFRRWFAGQSTRPTFREPDDPLFNEAKQQLALHGWEGLTSEQQRSFEDHQLSYITAEENLDGVGLYGWGELKGGIGEETITAVRPANDPHWNRDKQEVGLQKTFSRLRVSIVSAPQLHRGSMWVSGEDMRQFNSDDEPDEDFVSVQFYMLPTQIKSLADEISALPNKPELVVHAQSLMFRDEVAAFLSEPWHPYEFVILYDHATPAILNSIGFPFCQSKPAEARGQADGEKTSHSINEMPRAAAPSTTANNKQLKGIRLALWGIALAVLLAALIR